jgi:hypothetical protein
MRNYEMEYPTLPLGSGESTGAATGASAIHTFADVFRHTNMHMYTNVLEHARGMEDTNIAARQRKAAASLIEESGRRAMEYAILLSRIAYSAHRRQLSSIPSHRAYHHPQARPSAPLNPKP